MRKIHLFCILLSVCFSALSQKKIRLGNFDKKYFTSTHCPYDSSAGAFYISEYGKSRFDHNFEIEFTHHVVLKVLTPEEYDRGDVKIRFAKNDRVSGFEAVSYNMEDGKIVENVIKRKDAIIEDVNDNVRSFNFTFPNVKEGTIIEYTYKVNYGSVVRLNTWYFQRSIPVLRSQYEVIIPNYFTYERMYQGYFPLKTANVESKILPIGSGGSTDHQIHNYVGVNMPAFKNEPYITTKEDFISKIDFELKRYDFPGQSSRVYIPESFIAIGKQYYESEYWQGAVTDSKFTKDVVAQLKETSTNEAELARSIYYYVRDNFSEDYDVDYPTQKKVFQEKKGTANQINKILASMMYEAGIEANLVRISTRKNGKIWRHVAIDRQFNHTIVQANVNRENVLLDATEKNIPYEVLPDYCLNGQGLAITYNPSWVALEANKNNSITYGGTFELTEDLIIGDFTRKRSGYYAWDFLDNNEDLDEYKESFDENMETWIIDSHEISDLQNETTIEESLAIEVEGKVDDLGDVLYLNPIIFNQLEANPFKSPKRSFPINYGYPTSETHYYQIQLGDAYEVVELPKPLSVALPNNGGNLIFNVTQNGDVVTVMCRTQIKKIEFPAEEYPYLREFYAQKIEKQGEQIVLRRK